jgi:Integrase core domain
VLDGAHPLCLPIATPLDRTLRRPLESAQYTSGDYTQELTDHDVLGSIGTVGDALDNALAESYVDSYKTELIADRVWRSQAHVELATVTWVAWFNHQRLHSSLGDIPPVALNASIPFNGSVAGIPSNAADRLTTRRAWTLGVDFAGDRPISPRTVALLAAGPAQAAPQAGQG